nr:MAG TPA: hypothetical protein [Caudoviricetes sp.]
MIFQLSRLALKIKQTFDNRSKVLYLKISIKSNIFNHIKENQSD